MNNSDIQSKIEDYKNQDNACTAYPIYVVVQELQFVCVVDESYGNAHDCEIKYEYSYDGHEDMPFATKQEAVASIKEYYKGDPREELRKAINSIDEFPTLYRWTDVEYFLTKKGAEDYLAMDKHNLGKTRLYIKHFSQRNREMRNILGYCGFPISDQEL